ncbi:MAG: MOSC domain-containing protein [Ruminococcus sp.]|nr:MOSC domain-containing protein [Ruminococcus sp.]MBQ6153740.1 MOSC domain-containing protein [Ruminococcus sp.]
MKGTVLAVCISEKKGTKKQPVPSVTLEKNCGIIGDAHAVDPETPLSYRHRQVSLLADESVDKMRAKSVVLNAGDFAENILTKGINLKDIPIGTRLSIGQAILEVSQIGKQCHNDCEIKRMTGQCVMPTEGIFAVVIQGGEIKAGDEIITSLPLEGKVSSY